MYSNNSTSVHQLLITICCKIDNGSQLQESLCLGRVNISRIPCCLWLAFYLFLPIRSLNFLCIADQVNWDTQICFPVHTVGKIVDQEFTQVINTEESLNNRFFEQILPSRDQEKKNLWSAQEVHLPNSSEQPLQRTEVGLDQKWEFIN